MEKAKVYFIRDITPENIIKAYEAVGKKLTGKVAVKMHSGEQGNQNYLRPEFVKDVINYVNGLSLIHIFNSNDSKIATIIAKIYESQDAIFRNRRSTSI